MRTVWSRSPVIVSGLLLGACCACVSGYSAGNNGWQLNAPFQMEANADLVCKVHIGRVRDVGAATSQLFPGAPEVRRRIAEAQVLAVIKGSCPASIAIEFQFPADDNAFWPDAICRLYTELRSGESCLVFLHGFDSPYRLGRIQSKARVVASRVPYDLGEEPLLRLLAEFRAGLTCADEMVRLQATEELGYLGDALMRRIHPFEIDGGRSRPPAEALKQARQAIQPVRSSPDPVIRAAAIISSFQLADPPTLDETLRIFRADPNSFGPAASEAKYGIRDFCVAEVQRRLIEMMDATTRRAIKDLNTGSTMAGPGGRPLYRGVPGFPYARFFRAALAMDAVSRSEHMRRAIANVIWIRYEEASVPEMILLLDDLVQSIRRTAVSALNKCVNRNLSNEWDRRTFYQMDAVSGPSDRKPPEQRLQDYETHEREYLQYWKSWWAERRNEPDDEDVEQTPMSRRETEY
ncbi:MAG: hypothetical protein JW993_09175 [Sedimentisphaerales bacterium]|nr:hypothetical protein [Sedimentisphaerales bacterium]